MHSLQEKSSAIYLNKSTNKRFDLTHFLPINCTKMKRLEKSVYLVSYSLQVCAIAGSTRSIMVTIHQTGNEVGGNPNH